MHKRQNKTNAHTCARIRVACSALRDRRSHGPALRRLPSRPVALRRAIQASTELAFPQLFVYKTYTFLCYKYVHVYMYALRM